MPLLCSLQYHRPLPSTVWNDGHFFSACARCGVSMIKSIDGRWRPVPPGLRVVWRPRTDDDILWPTQAP